MAHLACPFRAAIRSGDAYSIQIMEGGWSNDTKVHMRQLVFIPFSMYLFAAHVTDSMCMVMLNDLTNLFSMTRKEKHKWIEKDVSMAFQKVHKQFRNDIKVKKKCTKPIIFLPLQV